MEIFDVHRRDIYNFDDYMDLKKPGFGGPSSAELLKNEKGKVINKDRKLTEYQNVVKRHPQFSNQVFSPTYKAMGGDLVHKQDVGENPYHYEDLYNNMGIASVEVGKQHTSKPTHFAYHTNEGMCNTDFESFINESYVVASGQCNCAEGEECKCGETCECGPGCLCESCNNSKK